MLNPGVAETEESTSGSKAVSADTLAHGQIQKISQEGSKNTYVLILSKDYLRSESLSGQSLLKYSAKSQSGKSNTNKCLPPSGGDYDSPSGQVAVRKKFLHPPEDVKLNLSNINDEEYDSNKSSSSVFLHESGFADQDSVIENENSHGGNSSSSKAHNFFCEKSLMNTYVIPTPVSAQPRKARLEQHAFKKTSPLKLTEQVSKVGFSAYSSSEKTSQSAANQSHATSNQDEVFVGHVGGVKKTTFTNEAVPVLGRSVGTAITPSTSLPKTNPKAVPTFSNISPINQQHGLQTPQSTFIPISPAESAGPITSTPFSADSTRRVQRVLQESSTHRPVYVIPSPFNRQNYDISLFTSHQNRLDCSSSIVQTPSMNNSSGFISASSSLETPEASCSYDGGKSIQPGIRYSPMESGNENSEVRTNGTNTAKSNDGSGGVVICVNEDGEIEELDEGFENNSLDPSVCSSQESESSDPVEKAGLNQSLTNIQWLKGMQLKDEKCSSQSQSQHYLQWMTLSPEEINAISKECGASKRPPFSYMGMIQMALNSREDRKMMLKEICKWIEETFPYYKYTAKPGWRNSIRHNLSLYNIFEREPAKRHGSYWTIKSDVEPKMKQYPREKHSSDKGSDNMSDTHRSMPTLPSQIPIIPMYSSMGQLAAVSPQTFSQSLQLPQNAASKKKGPPPILPRPTPYSAPQAYALIPIPNVNQPFNTASPSPAQQQVLLNLSQSGQMSACPSPIISEVSAAVASIQVSSASPIPQEHFCDTQSLQQEHFYNKPMNIVKQAWLNCQNSTDTASSIDSDRISQTDITSSSEIASSNDFTGSRSKSKRPRVNVKPGLPKPMMYKKEEKKMKTCSSKRRKLQQKARAVTNESSDEDEDGAKFISNLEKEIFSKPFKSLEAEDMEQLLTTSTPAKGLSLSTTDLPSPIHGLTPLRASGLFDGSFLDTLGDRRALGLSPDVSDRKKVSLNSPRLGDNPDDFLDFNVLPSLDKLDGSPSQNGNLSNQNLSRILSEYGLDPAMDNSEHFPNLNWSIMDQMVDSMDTS